MTKSIVNIIVKFPFFDNCTETRIMKLWIIFFSLEISREIRVYMTKLQNRFIFIRKCYGWISVITGNALARVQQVLERADL